MKVLIVAKTRRGSRACVGGITFAGESVRLVDINEATDEQAGMDYEVGEVWDVSAHPQPELTPPHVENIIVDAKRRLGPMPALVTFIERHMPAKPGDISVLFDGLTGTTKKGALYVAERIGVPPYSTMFWRPDQPLQMDNDGKRIRYRYPTPDGRYEDGPTLTFVGFQEPLTTIPAGTLLRVSLAHWWRPDEMLDGEYRCYVQLSGWYAEEWEADPVEEPEEPEPSAAVSVAAPPAQSDAKRLLKRVFGYDDFRPLQAEIIANVLEKRDTLVIMPTGGGKSLCYQLPALIFHGLTVVVSPLIALMHDQVTQLRELGISAAFLNSSLDYQSYMVVARQVRQGEIKLLYVAPETLLRTETLVMLDQSNVACLTIDEAHCISAWGHDFRPEYRQLMPVRDRYPDAVCIALTATATPRVQQDIQRTLGVTDSDEFIASFDRPNLYLETQPRTDGVAQLLTFLESHRDQSGIIYCSTRRQVDELTDTLTRAGWPALAYHAGLDNATRTVHQSRFVRDDAPIMVATIAFGMGINKSNVRFIVHFNLPENIESYYQQIGRAGRDGLRADCLLLYNAQDTGTIYHFIEQSAESERPGKVARLQAMERYATDLGCRRVPLLSYFGEEPQTATCDACDNCLADEDERETVDVTIPAQKFLSCVKRTDEIFGVTHIIDVLRGSKSKKVLAKGHNHLSTYGIGTEFSKQEWKRLAQHFIQQGLLKQDMQHGGVSLTAAAWEVLRGNEQVFVVAQPRPRRATAAASHDGVLFEELRRLRKELADIEQVPPYVVFSDRSLTEMATYFPQSVPAFMAINGVGEIKMEKYGRRFLDHIRAYCDAHGIEEQPRTAAASVRRPTLGGNKRRFEEVGELFSAGHSVADLQEMYNVKQATIIGHLATYFQAGHSVDGERVLAASQLAPDVQEAVLSAMTERGDNTLRPLFDAFNETVHWDELRILQLYYRCAAESEA